MVSMSIILPTARDNYAILGLEKIPTLTPTIESLKTQTFKDFELIVVDALYEDRPKLFQGDLFNASDLPFAVSHIPLENNSVFNHGYWRDQARWSVCGALNSGIIHAKGELLVRIDDCSEFGHDFLQRFWDGYRNGYFPMAMHIRYIGGVPALYNSNYIERMLKEGETHSNMDTLRKVYAENDLVRDTRYRFVKDKGGAMIAPHNWYYGYSSVPLKAALKINGYDELFDGDKSLEDVDFGSRLEMAGYKNKLHLDINHQVIEHEHMPISSRVNKPGKPIKCNYAIYLLKRKRKSWRSNASRLTRRDLRFIRAESLKGPCSPTPDFYDDNCNGKLFDMWANRRVIFDLNKERQIRSNV